MVPQCNSMTVLAELDEITTYKTDQTYDPHLAKLVRTVFFRPRLAKFKICDMSSVNGVGIELLFQFTERATEPHSEENKFEYWRTGYFHIVLIEASIEELTDKI